MIRSLACCTSELRRASLVRCSTSSVSAALSSASDTWVASACSELCTGREALRPEAVRIRPRVSPPQDRPCTSSELVVGGSSRSARSVSSSTGRPPSPRARLKQRVGGAGADRPRRIGAGAGHGHDLRRVLLEQADAHLHGLADQAAHGLQRRGVDLLAGGGRHQRSAGGAQHALTGDGALLLAVQPGHARHHQAEQHHRGGDHHDHVHAAVPDLVDQLDARCDQRGAGEQREPRRR